MIIDHSWRSKDLNKKCTYKYPSISFEEQQVCGKDYDEHSKHYDLFRLKYIPEGISYQEVFPFD
jgi:hypothetical protein